MTCPTCKTADHMRIIDLDAQGNQTLLHCRGCGYVRTPATAAIDAMHRRMADNLRALPGGGSVTYVGIDFGREPSATMVDVFAHCGRCGITRAIHGDGAECACACPSDPLDAVIDGSTLRNILALDQRYRREECSPLPRGLYTPALYFTSAQRAAISAHWSAQLRAKVHAGRERDRQQEVRVLADLDDVE